MLGGDPPGNTPGSEKCGRLTSEVRPEADIVAVQQPVHRLLHVGHVAGLIGAAGRSRAKSGRRPLPRAPPQLGSAHLRAAHPTASTRDSDSAHGPPRLAALIPAPAAPTPLGGRLQVGTERSNNCRQRNACAERSAVGTGTLVSSHSRRCRECCRLAMRAATMNAPFFSSSFNHLLAQLNGTSALLL